MGKKMFWAITAIVILLTIFAFPLILSDKDVLTFFIVFWILEVILIYRYYKGRFK